jgi:hypothetical protein
MNCQREYAQAMALSHILNWELPSTQLPEFLFRALLHMDKWLIYVHNQYILSGNAAHLGRLKSFNAALGWTRAGPVFYDWGAQEGSPAKS